MVLVRSGFAALLALVVGVACGGSDGEGKSAVSDGDPLGAPGTTGGTGGMSAPGSGAGMNSPTGGTSNGGGTGLGAAGGVRAGAGNGGSGGTGGAAGTGGAPSAGGFSSSTGGSPGTGSSGGGSCSPYPDDAPMITLSASPGTPLTMTGGTIVDGKYWLVSGNDFSSGAVPFPIAERIDISRGGTYFDDVAYENGSELRDANTIVVSGANVTFTIACGFLQGTTGTATFTATPSQFTTVLSSGVLKVYSRK